MANVMVTGGAGFIGSNIVDLLIEKGYNAAIVDNLSNGKKKNLDKRVKFYKSDICNSNLKKIFKKENPEFVIHLAAQVNVRKSILNPEFDANVNVMGSINLLECCKSFNVKKIVYASSGGAVYGEPQYLPADESHPINPISPYGASKHAVEHYLELYWKNFGIDYVSLRYSNVYGPRQDPFGEGGVIAIFAGRFLGNNVPVIFGDGEQTRDFVYVGDVANANLISINKKADTKIFNIGAGIETSVNEISEKLQNILNSGISPVHGDAIKGEVRRIYLDVRLAKKELGWKAETTLDEGLRKTIDWFRGGLHERTKKGLFP